MSAEEFKRQLEALSAEYRSALPDRLAEVETLWRESPDNAARLATLLRALHSISGSARTFGVRGVSEAAAAAESFLTPYCKRGKAPGPADCTKFEQLLDTLKRSAASDKP